MRFRYLRDPLFVFCVLLYVANRFVFRPLSPSVFLHAYLNDLICIPFWVPIMLWLMRRVGLRRDDAPPRASEVLLPLVIWSALFEVVLPRFAPLRGIAVGDHRDMLCYAAGATVAAAFWRAWYRLGGVQGQSEARS